RRRAERPLLKIGAAATNQAAVGRRGSPPPTGSLPPIHTTLRHAGVSDLSFRRVGNGQYGVVGRPSPGTSHTGPREPRREGAGQQPAQPEIGALGAAGEPGRAFGRGPPGQGPGRLPRAPGGPRGGWSSRPPVVGSPLVGSWDRAAESRDTRLTGGG